MSTQEIRQRIQKDKPMNTMDPPTFFNKKLVEKMQLLRGKFTKQLNKVVSLREKKEFLESEQAEYQVELQKLQTLSPFKSQKELGKQYNELLELLQLECGNSEESSNSNKILKLIQEQAKSLALLENREALIRVWEEILVNAPNMLYVTELLKIVPFSNIKKCLEIYINGESLIPTPLSLRLSLKGLSLQALTGEEQKETKELMSLTQWKELFDAIINNAKTGTDKAVSLIKKHTLFLNLPENEPLFLFLWKRAFMPYCIHEKIIEALVEIKKSEINAQDYKSFLMQLSIVQLLKTDVEDLEKNSYNPIKERGALVDMLSLEEIKYLEQWLHLKQLLEDVSWLVHFPNSAQKLEETKEQCIQLMNKYTNCLAKIENRFILLEIWKIVLDSMDIDLITILLKIVPLEEIKCDLEISLGCEFYVYLRQRSVEKQKQLNKYFLLKTGFDSYQNKSTDNLLNLKSLDEITHHIRKQDNERVFKFIEQNSFFLKKPRYHYFLVKLWVAALGNMNIAVIEKLYKVTPLKGLYKMLCFALEKLPHLYLIEKNYDTNRLDTTKLMQFVRSFIHEGNPGVQPETHTLDYAKGFQHAIFDGPTFRYDSITNDFIQGQWQKHYENSLLRQMREECLEGDEKGNAEDQYLLGYLYEKGLGGLKQERERAIALYMAASEQGLNEASCELGDLFRTGTLVRQDLSKALGYYQKAADNGSALAMNYLGLCYETGEYVSKDIKKALMFYQKAAELKFPEALANLARCYKHGIGVQQDLKQMVFYYSCAAEQYLPEACTELGMCYEFGKGVLKDVSRAIKLYERAKDRKCPLAQNRLGYMYECGIGVTKNIKRAYDYYEASAAQNFPQAYINLGRLEEAAGHLKLAYEYYQSAYNQQCPDAYYYVAMCCLAGKGVQKDVARAIACFKIAAKDLHHADSLYQLGFLGIQKTINSDLTEAQAHEYLKEASQRGSLNAQLLFAKLSQGKKKIKEALEYYTLAAKQGSMEASLQLAKLYENKGLKEHQDPEVEQNLHLALKYYEEYLFRDQGGYNSQNKKAQEEREQIEKSLVFLRGLARFDDSVNNSKLYSDPLAKLIAEFAIQENPDPEHVVKPASKRGLFKWFY